jgi:methyl-accepting chemotaxis protein
MMHDALRADVLAALHAASIKHADEAAGIKADLDEHVGIFKHAVAELNAMPLSPEVKEAVAKVSPTLTAYEAAAGDIVRAAFVDLAGAERLMPQFSAAFSMLETNMSALSSLIEQQAGAAEVAAQETAASGLRWLVVLIAVVGALCALFSLWTIRAITRPLRELREAIAELANGDGDLQHLKGFTAEFASVQQAFNTVLDELDRRRQQERERANAAVRVQQALSVATANVVIADPELQIIYVNDSAKNLMKKYGAAIQVDLPQLRPQALIGSSVAGLYQAGASVPQRVLQTRQSQQLASRVGQRHLQLTTSPVFNEAGVCLGLVVEIVDETAERSAAEQISGVLAAAVAGQLDSRLDVQRMDGFMRTMGEGINQMLDAIVRPLRAAAEHLSQIAAGTIPPPIGGSFNGEFAIIQKNLNTCSEVLRAMVDDVGRLVDAASAGQLNERADDARHWGDYRRIVSGMNQTMDAIVGPVTETTRVMSTIAEGDLTATMQGEYVGEFATLCQAVNTTATRLLGTVTQIRDAASNIGSAAAEISSGNQDLNRRTTEQAAALEETSASLRGITDTIKRNTDNAQRARDLANTAVRDAENGGVVVSDAVQAMAALTQSSSQIFEIISVIDGIAFQTNLLALNAAVEAARAGEQGRGFAVVAAEVRQLAQRTAEAAKEIKTLITTSVTRVKDGTRLVNASGETLQAIVSSVKHANEVITDIAEASAEQLRGINDLTAAVESMDTTTQQNAALVEEASAASDAMDAQAQGLTQLMAFFSVDGSGATAVATSSSTRMSGRRKRSRHTAAAAE